MSEEDKAGGTNSTRRVRRASRKRSRWFSPALISSFLLFSLFGAFVAGAGAQEVSEPEEKVPPRDESIVGGTAVRDGQFPFVVALIDQSRAGDDYQRQFCAGTLIDGDSVLTAAHCVDGRSPSTIGVRAGRTVLSSNQGVSRRVGSVEMHPRYNGLTSYAYDAAVLTLSKPIPERLVPRIKLLPQGKNGPEKPGRKLTIAGWGNTQAQPPGGGGGSSFPDRMRRAAVPVVSDSRAARAYLSTGRANLKYHETVMVAAGGNGRDACQGDSGGPMFVKLKSGGFHQVGITSYGLGCADPDYPGVYTEVNATRVHAFISSASS